VSAGAEPPRDCRLCPRLVDNRAALAQDHPDWWGGAVPSFGDPDARLLILGLAPGRMGAHRTGRPFAGDASGQVLFDTLHRFGFADQPEAERAVLQDVMITNAVRCLPPANSPTAAEITQCRPFLAKRIAALPRLRMILCLGTVAHTAILRALGHPASKARFGHGALHPLDGLVIADSYHCSRYNMNTKRLTPAMFDKIFTQAKAELAG